MKARQCPRSPARRLSPFRPGATRLRAGVGRAAELAAQGGSTKRPHRFDPVHRFRWLESNRRHEMLVQIIEFIRLAKEMLPEYRTDVLLPDRLEACLAQID